MVTAMELERNPVKKIGERNFQCPNYETCLDHCTKSGWQFWTCSQCSNRLQGTGVTLVKCGLASVRPDRMGPASPPG
jgi:hypothetical protein